MVGPQAEKSAVSMVYGKADKRVGAKGGRMAVWTDGVMAERMAVHLAGPMVGQMVGLMAEKTAGLMDGATVAKMAV